MSIRITVKDRSTGETLRLDAPRRGEHVKDGKTTLLPPNKDEVANVIAVLKGRSVLGMRGGCLA